eukprot:6491119-Amphidinium_carterae.2
MAATPGKRKASALKASFVADSSIVKQPRKRGNAGIDHAIEKAVADHCKGLSNHQMEVRVVEGSWGVLQEVRLAVKRVQAESKQRCMCSKTFMEHLRHELELKAKGTGCTGAHFWCRMETWFGDADEPSDALDLSTIEGDGTDIEGLAAFQAFAQMVPPSYNREAMTSWATVASTCSKAEAIIAATALRRLRPALGGDHYKCGCAIMQMLKRCEVPEKYPLVVEAVVNKLDLFLEQNGPEKWVGFVNKLPCPGCCGGFAPETLKYYRQTGCDPVEFIEENSALARLVFHKDILDPILKIETTADLKTVAKEIHTLYSTKRSGALLFSSAVKSLVVTEVERIIKEGIDELGKTTIDESKYHAALASTSKLLDDLPGVELVGKREVIVCYRGIEMSTTVKTPRSQAELCFQAFMRGHAARMEVLVALPGEGVVTSDVGSGLEVKKEMMAKANRARNTFLKAVKTLKKGEKPTGGNEIKASCDKRKIFPMPPV